jgi:exo-1,4-beta-D-glucosaminidase
MKIFSRILLSIFVICGMQNLFGQDSQNAHNEGLVLSKWQLKSTVLEKTSGEDISTGHYITTQWYPVDVPSTVLNGLVKNGVYPDPRIDMNNYQIPDISDEFNAKYNLAKYSYLPNHENPWKSPYWFRTEFKIPVNEKGRQIWLNFNGINYRAEVWLNGKRIADSVEMAGMFQRFKYNVTGVVKDNETNYLAVKIYPVDHPGIPGAQLIPNGGSRGPAEEIFKDLTLKISGGWDCAMPVRDRNMGIYQDVFLTFTDDVDIINPYIITDLPLPDTTLANLSVTATLYNTSNKKQSGLLKGKIDLLTEMDMGGYTKKLPGNMQSVTFEKEVEVPANDAVTVTLTYKDFPQLAIKDPYLWWPTGYGEQYLHNLQLSFEYDGKVSAQKNTSFGIREVTSALKEIDGNYGMVFSINGKRVFCKGGWIQPDMLLDLSKKRLYDEARLLTNANMNMLGTEDMPSPTEDFMDACDKYGIMLWETFYQCWTTVPGTKTAYFPLDHYLAIKNAHDIVLRYRNNPSLVVWCAENENVPGPDLYFALRDDLKNLDKTRPFIPTSSTLWDWEKLTPYIKDEMPVGVTDIGAPGYTWHPSAYFFNKIDEVKLQMFRDELGIPSVPTLSSLKKFILNPGNNKNNPIFPLDSVWAEHGVWDVNGYAYKSYDNAIRNNYGFNTKSIEDYVRIAQIVNADGYRAMFEAANSRMWDITSGVMLWKLNCSAPDVLWSIYDWYLNPHAGYYFTKKACESLHIQLNANDYQVSVINTNHRPVNKLKVRARIYDFNLNVKWEHEEAINVGEDRYQEIFRVPQLSDITPVYLVRLELLDENGKVISNNLYWESSKNPVDFSELSYMKYAKLDLTYTTEETKDEYLVSVKVKNTTDKLSFMNRLAIIRNDNKEEVLPTIWNDNFITVFPGEGNTVEARFSKKDLNGSAFSVIVDNN